MKRLLLIVAAILCAVSAFAQPQYPAYQLPSTLVAQKWYGSGAPTSALNVPSQPGDLYYDTTNKVVYFCAAPTTAIISINGGNPACTTVTAGGWTLIPTNSSVTIGSVVANVCHAQYVFATDGGGSPGLITPANNCVIPANSIIYNEIIDWTTAGTGATNITAIGLAGTGGAINSLLHATAVASLTGIVQGQIVPQTASGFVKVTTAGGVTFTTAVAALTAGVCDVFVMYLTASN